MTADSIAEAPRRVVLDNRRTPCAVGLIKADTLMQELEPRTQLEIWSRDVFAPMEVKLWAEKSGFELESHVKAGVWPHRHHVFVVLKP